MNQKTVKSLSALLSLLLLVTALAGCGGGSEIPSPETKQKEAETKPVKKLSYLAEIDTAGDYAYNPSILRAYKSAEKTLLVEFSEQVGGYETHIMNAVTVCADENGASPIACTAAYPLDPDSNDGYTLTVSTKWDLTFASAIPDGGVLVVSEPAEQNDGDKASSYAFMGGMGEGCVLNATVKGLQAATVKIGSEKIEKPKDTRPYIVSCRKDSQFSFTVTFSEPVRFLDNQLTNHCFFSDNASPNPGVGDSWQYGVVYAQPQDKTVGKDGKTYYQVYTVRTKDAIPDTAVFRLSENDAQASNEYTSDPTNDDCGRVCVGISGQPVQAQFTSGWDVSFVAFSK